MAQLVEQRIRNAWVGGSSPPIGSTLIKFLPFPSRGSRVRVPFTAPYEEQVFILGRSRLDDYLERPSTGGEQ